MREGGGGGGGGRWELGRQVHVKRPYFIGVVKDRVNQPKERGTKICPNKTL